MVQQGFERIKLNSLWYVISHQDFKIRNTCVLLFVQGHAHNTATEIKAKLIVPKIQHKQCQSNCGDKCSDLKLTYSRIKMSFLQNIVFQNRSTYILKICLFP